MRLPQDVRITRYLVETGFERERQVSVEEVHSVIHRDSDLGEVAAGETFDKRAAAESKSEFAGEAVLKLSVSRRRQIRKVDFDPCSFEQRQ